MAGLIIVFVLIAVYGYLGGGVKEGFAVNIGTLTSTSAPKLFINLFYPVGAIVCYNNLYYIASSYGSNSFINTIDKNKVITRFAGTGQSGYMDGPRLSARFSVMSGMAFDSKGNLFVAETENPGRGQTSRLRKIDINGNVSTVATIPDRNQAMLLAIDIYDNVYITAWIYNMGQGGHAIIYKVDTKGNISLFAGLGDKNLFIPEKNIYVKAFNEISWITTDSKGFIYIQGSSQSGSWTYTTPIIKFDQSGTPTIFTGIHSYVFEDKYNFTSGIEIPNYINGFIDSDQNFFTICAAANNYHYAICRFSENETVKRYRFNGYDMLPVLAQNITFDPIDGTIVLCASYMSGNSFGADIYTISGLIRPTPVDCAVSNWSPYGACTTNCGPGTKTRTRTVTKQAMGSGQPCPALTETVDCGNPPCKADCVLSSSDFEGTGTCVPNVAGANCGPGTLMRPKKVTSAAVGGGACNNPPVASGNCLVNGKNCPVDCELSSTDYTSLPDCKPKTPGQDCGPGIKERVWKVLKDALYGGKCDNPPQVDPAGCLVNNKKCGINCTTPWTNVGTCEPKSGKTCGPGNGTQKQKRTVNTPGNGEVCNEADLATERTIDCDLRACASCVIGTTPKPVGPCVSQSGKECGEGIQKYEVDFTPAEDGGSCPGPKPAPTYGPCLVNDKKCDVKCETSGWTNSGVCEPKSSGACGIKGGYQLQTRSFKTPSKYESCIETDFSTTKKVSCDLPECPEDCQPGAWEMAPNARCIPKDSKLDCGKGAGVIEQVRTVKPANSTGKCSDEDKKTSQKISCDLPECPVDCKPSAWRPWSKCEPSGGKGCGPGGGSRSRMRDVKPANSTGKCSEEDSQVFQTEKCDLPECPIDCKADPWSPWSACKGTCGAGNGTTTRTRNVRNANSTGRQCEPDEQQTVETAKCDMPDCPVDCKVGPWSAWSPIGKVGNDYMLKRVRNVQLGNLTGRKCTDDETRTVETKKCDSCPELGDVLKDMAGGSGRRKEITYKF